MPAAMKIILGELMATRPDISVLDLATTAVDDHIVRNGCEFEYEAAGRAVAMTGIAPDTKAQAISRENLMALGDMLEEMETNCPHKVSPGAAKCMPT